LKKSFFVAILFGMLLLINVPLTSASVSGQLKGGSTLTFGDAYANAVITSRSAWYSNGDNALGPPDNENATIYVDYGYGYLTLDMGQGEDIIDGSGNDFSVIATGSYRVGVAATLESAFVNFDYVNDTHDFDLDTVGLDSARYVRIELYLGTIVSLDAIVAINYNVPSDNEAPTITPIDDITLQVGQYNTTLQWTAGDEFPQNYTILINGQVELSDEWDGSNIQYTAVFEAAGEYNVTLLLFDSFGHHASDSVMITVVGDSTGLNTTLLILGAGVMILIVIGVVLFMRKRSST
jgi:hypothetical protein